MSGAIKARQRVERSIARRVILDALRAGYSLSVYNGEEAELQYSTDVKAIIAAMFTTDEDWLLFHKTGSERTANRAGIPLGDGWVRFIYGNDGWDVINDYTVNLEDVLKGANALADRYSE